MVKQAALGGCPKCDQGAQIVRGLPWKQTSLGTIRYV